MTYHFKNPFNASGENQTLRLTTKNLSVTNLAHQLLTVPTYRMVEASMADAVEIEHLIKYYRRRMKKKKIQ